MRIWLYAGHVISHTHGLVLGQIFFLNGISGRFQPLRRQIIGILFCLWECLIIQPHECSCPQGTRSLRSPFPTGKLWRANQKITILWILAPVVQLKVMRPFSFFNHSSRAIYCFILASTVRRTYTRNYQMLEHNINCWSQRPWNVAIGNAAAGWVGWRGFSSLGRLVMAQVGSRPPSWHSLSLRQMPPTDNCTITPLHRCPSVIVQPVWSSLAILSSLFIRW